MGIVVPGSFARRTTKHRSARKTKEVGMRPVEAIAKPQMGQVILSLLVDSSRREVSVFSELGDEMLRQWRNCKTVFFLYAAVHVGTERNSLV